ncbi:hypothetical protein CSOJ01_08472 [Colletotrichum sojae]|uniref:F-box domain-containing protein n=1 Tax=Colletotrichum sojae TaxID=2175907 RepID=A0A8H6J619_9PEZI|nr:hypothetical protein CSOJ01_08472 [Colletotrichum sojae]
MAETRAQRWLQEGAKSSTDAKGFYSVPREILFTITAHLPANEKVALALAGKFFFTSLYPDGIRITDLDNEEDRLFLLLFLEQDVQELYLCFGCKKLRPPRPKRHQHQQRSHPGCGPHFQVTPQSDFDFERNMQERYWGCPNLENWAPRWVMRSNPLTWRPYPHPLGPQSAEVKKEKWPEITFSQAYRVMQRHRLGTPYGLPIESLEKRFEFERHISPGDKTKSHFALEQHTGNDVDVPGTSSSRFSTQQHPESTKTWHVIHEYSARISDHQLGIRRSHQIRGPSCSVADLSKVIEDLELPICAHIFASAFTPASGVFPDHNSCVHELHALWLAGRDPLLNRYSDQGGAH